MSRVKKKPKKEFSKVWLGCVGAVTLIVTAFTLATGFYYSKAKAENRIKLRKQYGPEIYNDTKEM